MNNRQDARQRINIKRSHRKKKKRKPNNQQRVSNFNKTHSLGKNIHPPIIFPIFNRGEVLPLRVEEEEEESIRGRRRHWPLYFLSSGSRIRVSSATDRAEEQFSFFFLRLLRSSSPEFRQLLSNGLLPLPHTFKRHAHEHVVIRRWSR